MPITKLPEMVACAGAVVVSSASRALDPVLTVTLNTEEGDRYMLPLSERAITQLSEVITGWRRTRDFPDQTGDLGPINGRTGQLRSLAHWMRTIVTDGYRGLP
jgi:hypothetical protein